MEQSTQGCARAGRTGAMSGSRTPRKQTGWALCCSETASTDGRLPAPCGTRSLCRPGRSEVRGEMPGIALGVPLLCPGTGAAPELWHRWVAGTARLSWETVELVEVGVIIVTPLYSHLHVLQGLLPPFHRCPSGRKARQHRPTAHCCPFLCSSMCAPSVLGAPQKLWP